MSDIPRALQQGDKVLIDDIWYSVICTAESDNGIIVRCLLGRFEYAFDINKIRKVKNEIQRNRQKGCKAESNENN